MYVFIDVYINIRYNNKCKGGDNKTEKSRKEGWDEAKAKIKTLGKRKSRVKEKARWTRPNDKRAKDISSTCNTTNNITILEIVEKILNYLK